MGSRGCRPRLAPLEGGTRYLNCFGVSAIAQLQRLWGCWGQADDHRSPLPWGELAVPHPTVVCRRAVCDGPCQAPSWVTGGSRVPMAPLPMLSPPFVLLPCYKLVQSGSVLPTLTVKRYSRTSETGATDTEAYQRVSQTVMKLLRHLRVGS